MSAGGARRGRRDNGLEATEYAVAGDVDPRLGEHLLDVLAAGGIAAYLQPSADLNPVTRTTTVPPRPVDRLYVDRSFLATARDYLTQLADEDPPGQPPAPRPDPDPDVEAEWARIVAGYHTEVAADSRSWPAAEDVVVGESTDRPGGATTTLPAPETPKPADPGVRRLPSATDFSGISVGGRADDPSLLDGLDTFGADLPDDAEERYVPPPPPPLPRPSKYAVVGVLAIVAGFALFLFPDLIPIDRGLVTMLGFAGILTGFVTLIWRLRPGNEEDDDPDDGAVV
ncbi:DUF308 domain-containing protein [Plantactinospora endophytica]|uniref:DUF308 domain-containing protein n=1 Tax=Plantactinospora endophytica TaxID=673535 RepID=A0ABQ4E723_9ACTN|nr:DUF308 domain-containing protein [Plantactinospora endophytica]GIG90121.1 hypothetical protein Pen02_50570 [Plantactinospora endophytica]